MDKTLRLHAAFYVMESELSKAAKIQMLNFIKEDASDAQIKALMMDGGIVHLDEQAEEIVNDRFAVSHLQEDPIVAMGVAAGGFAVATLLTWATSMAIKSYKKRMTAAGAACKGKKGGEYKACMTKYQMAAEQEKMKVYQKAQKQCSKSKVPARCEMKVGKLIAKQKRTIDKYKERHQRARRSFGHGGMK